MFNTVTGKNASVAVVWRLCCCDVTSLHGGVPATMSERDQLSKQVERLASSSVLHGSESLCKLLRYLANHTLDHPGTPLKEYQIATELFGRRSDFDPQIDSTIRVQAGRLRAKLSEYYAANGSDDPILVELPKGSYTLQFHHRATGDKGGSNGHAPGRHSTAHPWLMATVALSILLVLALAFILTLLRSSKGTQAALASEPDPIPPEFHSLWKPFLSGPREPWLIFSNAGFVGRPETGMRYYNSARDSGSLVWDHYTGVGEVLAVHDLDQVFETLHRRIRVKRGSLFSLDDLKDNDLIFLGSPSENLTLMEIPSTREFVFQRVPEGPRKGDLAIVNVHPQGTEVKTFLASPSTALLTEDYAVVGFMSGLDPARSVMILAGTTTFGTQGAVEYICSQDSLRNLLSRLGKSNEGNIQPFEALLHVKVTHGVPVETQLIAVRERTN